MTVPLTPGSVFARDFRVVRPLSAGGMGAVYVVEQVSTRRLRALKVMLPALVQDARSRDRFAQEATVGARIPSDHVVEVIGAGVDEATGIPWLVMELLEGQDLSTVMGKRGKLPPAEVYEIYRQLCHGVAAAHRAGLVHRDLKPENVFMAAPRHEGVPFTVKILDFGIAKLIADSRALASSTAGVGTPYWMAPEQTNSAAVSPATDVWALGLIAYFLLTGTFYWKSALVDDTAGLMREVFLEPLEPASVRAAWWQRAGTLPPTFDAWFARCVAREPQHRFRDATEALAALGPALALPPPSPPSSVTSVPAMSAAPGPVLGAAPGPVLGAAPTHQATRQVPEAPTTPATKRLSGALVIGAAVVGSVAVGALVVGAGLLGGKVEPARPGPAAASGLRCSARSLTADVVDLTAVAGVAAGRHHTCAWRADGSAWCWGWNVQRQVGDDTTEDRTRPTPVLGLNAVSAIAAGETWSCALRTDRTAWCWGLLVGGQQGRARLVEGVAHATQLCTGQGFACARTAEGAALCWGDGDQGQLGDGTTAARPAAGVVPGLAGVDAVACGGYHACARLRDGTAWCWGRATEGQLGAGVVATEPALRPARVPGLAGVAALTAGENHTCARLVDGSAWCWGANNHGQLGDGAARRAAPARVPGVDGVLALVAGYHHTCALRADGATWCWGENVECQLGGGALADGQAPRAVPGLDDAVALAAGGAHTCAATRAGTARCWGFNAFGQLGNGAIEQRPYDVR